jgi:hypothetical protein
MAQRVAQQQRDAEAERDGEKENGNGGGKRGVECIRFNLTMIDLIHCQAHHKIAISDTNKLLFPCRVGGFRRRTTIVFAPKKPTSYQEEA